MRPLLFLVAAIAFAQGTHIKSAATQLEEGKRALRAEHFAEAVQYFQDALKIEPTFLDAYEQLINAELKSNHPLEAGAAITRLLEIEPGNLTRRLQLARILLDENQAERALAQYSLALSRDAKNAEALLGFAEAATHAGMPERASQALERGRAFYPADKRFNTNSKSP